jgi:RNA polymerase sigma-70 factor (ECF subfamily)
MEPVAASGFLTTSFTSTAEELDDFDSVVRLHWPAVFRFALASLRDQDAAQTLTQDCFVHAWRGRTTFRGGASVKTWILRIAVNLVRDRARNRRLQFWKRAAVRSLDIQVAGERIADEQLSSEARVLRDERVRAIWEVGRTLPEQQRTAFLLRFVEDMDLLEIAAAMGLKEGTVKVHLFRAVQAVRERLGGVG